MSYREFPSEIPGVPLHFVKLSREDLQPLIEKMLKRVASWRGRLLSYGARLNDVEGNRKYHLANWELVSMCKEFGGLGIPNLRDLNRYISGDGKLWKEIIDFKYNTTGTNIFDTRVLGASQFFKSFMYAARAAKMGFRWKIRDGKKVKFWKDNWLGSSSLAIQYWNLYVPVNEKNSSVTDMWDGVTLKCTFRRTFDVNLYLIWLEVVQLASTINFSDDEDALIWQFTSFGIYTSQFLYKPI
ncbi:hypothetical protein U9M48_001833, partial [Paspalum notatum var. saurae]